MSLRVWLPLNGNLNNQGLSHQTNIISTTPIWAPIGKIGGNALYTKTRMTTINFPELNGVSIYSVAYWLYIPTEVAPTSWSDMFGIQFKCSDGTNAWERDERRASTITGRHNYHLAKSGSEGANTNAYYGTKEDDSANNNWIHVVLTKDNNNAKLYFNGQLQTTVNTSAFEDAPRTMTGNIYLGDNGCEAYLQDFRIYDHCLSVKEIEEISKGLCCHWKMSEYIDEGVIYDDPQPYWNPFMGLFENAAGYPGGNTFWDSGLFKLDTNRYNYSLWRGSYYNIYSLESAIDFLPTDSITVNLWMKCSKWGNPISCTEGGGWNFENSSGIQFPVYIKDVGYKIAKSGIQPSTLLNNWHMLTGTFDKQNVKIYIDGILKGTTPTGSTNPIKYHSSNSLQIGAEATGGGSSLSDSDYIGNLSDIRIYATALTEKQILELYNTSMAIDDNSNIFVRELIEILGEEENG